MGRLRTITRRSFLVASVAVAGGVAFGVWASRRQPANPLSGEGVMNPWVILAHDGITLVAPRAEMGQGASTTLAALVAEELDVSMEQIKVIHGPSAAAYYNATIVENAIGGPHWARGSWGEWVAEQAGRLPKISHLQITGGSTSMADGYIRLRQAGASAREALKAAAAARWDLPIEDLDTAEGMVIAPDGRSLSYQSLALEAAKLPPTAPKLRPASQWRILGQSQPRVDQLAKVTGQARFGIDVRLPGMKFASLKRNPYLGGKMLSYDGSKALKASGVEAVVPLEDGVAVIARTTWQAMQALELVEVEWGPARYPASSAEHEKRLDQALYSAPNSELRLSGDLTAPREADVLRTSYKVPYLAHATMEPMTAAAWFNEGHLTLWAGTQAPGLAVMNAASALGIATDHVTLETTFLGGGFGRRAESDFTTLAALIAAAIPGTPVLTTWSREEDMTHDVYRPTARAEARGWLEGGRISGIDLRLSAPSVTRQATSRLAGLPGMGADRAIVEGAFDQPYDIPNARVRGYLADIEVPVGFWRSVGNSQNAFFHESFIDEMAHAAGADPLAFRLDHIKDEASRAVIKAVSALSGWSEPPPQGRARGMAFCHSFGTPVAQVIEVEEREGLIHIPRAFIACDPGIALDPAIIESQMIGAMVFGLSAAIRGEITFDKGRVQQSNFHDQDLMRITAMPEVRVTILQSRHGIGGVGEPGTPPAAPALANAIFALKGQRIRTLPLERSLPFAT